jgi:DNA-binding transcriptional MerR regulator
VNEPKQLSKMDIKRQQIYAERRKRHINNGVPAEKVGEVMAKEDFERLPIDKRVQMMIAGSTQSLAQEIINLQYNDSILATAMDVNFRALKKAFDRLGVSSEQLTQCLTEARAEVQSEMEEKAKKAREEATESPEAVREAVEDIADKAGKPAEAPPEATVFGG